MNVVLPAGVQDALQKSLRTGFDRGDSSYGGAHNVLLAVPELAREPTTRALLERTLLDPAIGYRWHAARILVALGDPAGLLHLTYNSLQRHPLLGQDNTRFSGWHEAVLRYADKLDGQCIELLAGEMKSPVRGFHGVSLAVAGESLDRGSLDPRHAAFQAAWRGDTDAIDPLVEWLATEPGRNAVAIWAILRNVRSPEGSRHIAQLHDPSHPLYDVARNRHAPFMRFALLPLLDFAHTIIECGRPHALAHALLRHYLVDFDGNPAGAPAAEYALEEDDLGDRFISAMPGSGFAFPSSLLAVLGDLFPGDLPLLARLQHAAIRRYIEARGPVEKHPGLRPAFLTPGSLPPRGVDGIESQFYQLKGFEVRIDEQDLLREGVAWLREPLRYVGNIH
jgi:hypothetical protein